MKKLFLAFILSLLFHFCFSQYYLGLTENEMLATIQKKNQATNLYKGYTNLTKNGVPVGGKVLYYSWVNKGLNCNSIVYFNVSNISSIYIDQPLDDQTLSLYIKFLNSHYVIISSTEWNYYTDNKVVLIKLSFKEETRQYSFIYTLKTD